MLPIARQFSRPLRKCALRLLGLVVACSLLELAAARLPPAPAENGQFADFIAQIEQLVLTTTDRALNVTRNVYVQLSAELPPPLRQASAALMHDYVERVDAALSTPANYTQKRLLFQQYKRNCRQLEALRQQLSPDQPPFEFQLISEEFYNTAQNRSEFDNLYLSFMRAFEAASQRLWGSLAERTVEEHQEMLELIDEIAQEKRLPEKDKLYDEFIEMYLFKTKTGINQELS